MTLWVNGSNDTVHTACLAALLLAGDSLHPLRCFPSPGTGHSISHLSDLYGLKTKGRKIKRKKSQSQQQEGKIRSLTQFLVSAWSYHSGRAEAVWCGDGTGGWGDMRNLQYHQALCIMKLQMKFCLKNTDLYKQNYKHSISSGTLMMMPSTMESPFFSSNKWGHSVCHVKQVQEEL